MCFLRTNHTADAGFTTLGQATNVSKYERTLIDLAAAESPQEEAKGFERRLKPLLSWQHHPTLRGVRKIRLGEHRVYVQGRHTDCSYLICLVIVHKRDEEDRAEDPRFQHRVLSALEEPVARTLYEPARESPPTISLPADLLDRAFGQGDQEARRNLTQVAKRALIAAYQAVGQPIPSERALDSLVHSEVRAAEAGYWAKAESPRPIDG